MVQYNDKNLNQLLEMISQVSNRLMELEFDVEIKCEYKLLSDVAEMMMENE